MYFVALNSAMLSEDLKYNYKFNFFKFKMFASNMKCGPFYTLIL